MSACGPSVPDGFRFVQPHEREWAGVFISFDLNREQNFVEPIQRGRRQWLGYYNYLGNGLSSFRPEHK